MHDHQLPHTRRHVSRLRQPHGMNPSPSAAEHARQRSEETWDLCSRPSSSLSSATDEIITTGLTVQHDSNLHRRNTHRREENHSRTASHHKATETEGNSSQEEYEESESESDKVLAFSTEVVAMLSPKHPQSVASSEATSGKEDDDVDENATAVNLPRSSRRDFQPRPNAFSHPLSQQPIRPHSGTAYTPQRSTRPLSQRQQSYPQHSSHNTVPPRHQVDHDEVLRASLSTLLSAAAAVRGLPKAGKSRMNPVSMGGGHPTSLRFISESVALGGVPEEATTTPPISRSSSDQSKPKVVVSSNTRHRRTIKQGQSTTPLIEEVSPTLFTWVISAGVVVLVSALSFSAGYVVGKEAGHAEAIGQLGDVGADASRCGQEVAASWKTTGLGLRKQILASTSIRA